MTEKEALSVKIEEAIVDLDPREKYTLEQLGKKLRGSAITPEGLARMLPEALDDAGEQRDAITSSMTPLTEEAIDLSVQKDPAVLSTALFPVIGGAIRKAVARAMSELVANMNTGLESVFSLKRLAWRLEAIKTGKSYFDVMLAHTIEFSVDHVFLIHKKTSLLLASISREGMATADDDMVSSMLTAIQSYIKDSLQLDREHSVEEIQAGEYRILAEEGPRAILAVIVNGSPAPAYREKLRETLEKIHIRLARHLKTFNGDVSHFEKNSDLLLPCLERKSRDVGKKKPVYTIVLLSLIAIVAGFFITMHSYRLVRENRAIKALEAEPGLLVLSVKRAAVKTRLAILRDKHASTVEDVLESLSLPLDMFIIAEEPFYSPHFSNPPGPREIPAHLLEIAEKLGSYVFFFVQDSGEILDGQEAIVREAGELVSLLVDEAVKEGFVASVEVTGHAAGSVQDTAAIQLSEERAQMAYNYFIEINAPLAQYVSARGVGVSEPVVQYEQTEEDRIKNRSVTFKAVIKEMD